MPVTRQWGALSKVASSRRRLCMTYARSGTCRAGRRCVGGFVRDCQTQHNAETNLAPLRRGFFVEVACTLSQASPVMTTICLGADIETNPLAPRLSDGLIGRGAFLGAWPLRQECARGRPVSPHDARRHLAPLRSGAAFSFGLRRISDTATKSSARRSVGGLPSNAGARFPVYRSLCWARAQVGKLFAS